MTTQKKPLARLAESSQELISAYQADIIGCAQAAHGFNLQAADDYLDPTCDGATASDFLHNLEEAITIPSKSCTIWKKPSQSHRSPRIVDSAVYYSGQPCRAGIVMTEMH